MNFQDWKRINVERLREAGIEYPEEELRLILSEMFVKKRATILFDPNVQIDAIFNQEERRQIDAVIKGRVERNPLGYLLGEQFFYRNAFSVGPGVLIPRSDSELLVGVALYLLGIDDSFLGAKYETLDRVKRIIDSESIKIMDLCAGTGCIGISIANVLSQYLVEYNMILTENSETAKPFLMENMSRAAEPDRIELVMCDLFPPVSQWKKWAHQVQLIVANPPYIADHEMDALMPEVVDHEPQEALRGGRDGLHFYHRILSEATTFLCSHGVLAVEHGYLQRKDIENLFLKYGFEDVACLKDYGDNDRVTIGRWKKGEEEA